jgi:hypothetical protein
MQNGQLVVEQGKGPEKPEPTNVTGCQKVNEEIVATRVVDIWLNTFPMENMLR